MDEMKIKEPWQLTKKEVEELVSDISEYVQRTPKGQYPDRRLSKKLKEYFLSLDEYYALSGGKHQKLVQQAVSEGKSIPIEVLKDYPELMPQMKVKATKVYQERKAKPLPSDVQNVQTVPFDSQLFDCYGKQTKRGFRAYCRRK